MGTTQIEQHAIAPSHRDDAQGGDGGRSTDSY